MFDYELLIPIVLFLCIAFVMALGLWLRTRTRLELQNTVRLALDKGQELTPELIDRLGQPQKDPRADLRKGLVWLAVGAGFAAFGLILDERDAVRPLIATGAFPFIIGVAYLIMSLVSGKDTST